jgi:hypothetical protein
MRWGGVVFDDYDDGDWVADAGGVRVHVEIRRWRCSAEIDTDAAYGGQCSAGSISEALEQLEAAFPAEFDQLLHAQEALT